MSRTVEVEVLTKQGCHLCEDALAVAREVCAEFSVPVLERDITEDVELLASFAEEIPVLRINGRVKDFWRIDPQRLRRLLREAAAES
ncbi:glutaredoxin family protein [Nesterenkonia sp. CF4.4]|uniref:glutaredoxin family protein n=1 Tax=Nesterenkonia sp. CF4.4 TaxID=3373079 RepID=UPI003EE50207